MRILESNEPAGARVLALGTFDGVHRGHQELIRQGQRLARELGAALRVCTFDRHPLEVLRPEAAPALLETGPEQAARLAAMEVEELRIIPFTRETAETEPEEFLAALRRECDLKAVVAGWNYTFGRRGRGDAELLTRDGAAHGYRVEIVPPVKNGEGEVISSTAIRNRLTEGDIAGANEMLGEPYRISGMVVNGKHEGTRIGYPTANIAPPARKLLPAYGVYVCELSCGEESWDAVVNIGLQPTLPSGGVTVEAHALDADINLYGREATVTLLERLRGERRFDSVEALVAQIGKDQQAAREFFQQQTETYFAQGRLRAWLQNSPRHEVTEVN